MSKTYKSFDDYILSGDITAKQIYGCTRKWIMKKVWDDRQPEIDQLKKQNDILKEALCSIEKNGCCDKCQEAALVAREALDKIKQLNNN